MILADTSVLIDYLKGNKNSATEKMAHIIDNDIPYGICTYVYQELLQGSANEHEYGLLKDYFGTLPFYDLRYGKESHENAAYMCMLCRKNGISVRSTIDFLIAETAIENELYLFHNDSDFTNISQVYNNLKIY